MNLIDICSKVISDKSTEIAGMDAVSSLYKSLTHILIYCIHSCLNRSDETSACHYQID